MPGRVAALSPLLMALLAAWSGAIALGRTSPAPHSSSAASANPQPPKPSPAGTPVTATAKGPFDVKLTPQGTGTDPTAVGRMTLDKTFHGELDAILEVGSRRGSRPRQLDDVGDLDRLSLGEAGAAEKGGGQDDDEGTPEVVHGCLL